MTFQEFLERRLEHINTKPADEWVIELTVPEAKGLMRDLNHLFDAGIKKYQDVFGSKLISFHLKRKK